MACTKAGGIKVRETIYAKYGRDFYKKMGAIGGKTPTRTPKGFAANRELARLAASKGGRISRRRKPGDESVRRAYDDWLSSNGLKHSVESHDRWLEQVAP